MDGKASSDLTIDFHNDVFAVTVKPCAVGGGVQCVEVLSHSGSWVSGFICFESQRATLFSTVIHLGWQSSTSEQESQRFGEYSAAGVMPARSMASTSLTA
jgi:hypothetical protein